MRLPSWPIKTLVQGCIAALGVAVVIAPGHSAWQARQGLADATRVQTVNEIGDHLLTATENLAIERDITNTALRSADPLLEAQLAATRASYFDRFRPEIERVVEVMGRGAPAPMNGAAWYDLSNPALAAIMQLRTSRWR